MWIGFTPYILYTSNFGFNTSYPIINAPAQNLIFCPNGATKKSRWADSCVTAEKFYKPIIKALGDDSFDDQYDEFSVMA